MLVGLHLLMVHVYHPLLPFLPGRPSWPHFDHPCPSSPHDCYPCCSKFAYIIIAMKGKSFCSAARIAVMTILTQAAQVGTMSRNRSDVFRTYFM